MGYSQPYTIRRLLFVNRQTPYHHPASPMHTGLRANHTPIDTADGYHAGAWHAGAALWEV